MNGMHWVAELLVLLGAVFVALAAVGITRLPDFYTRIHAASKSASLGLGLLLAGAAWHFQTTATTVRALAVIGFIFLTTPIATHLVARAAYRLRVPLWHRSVVDELAPNGQTEQGDDSAS